MKYEIELDWIQTYKMVVEADSHHHAEQIGDNIDMEEFDRQRAEISRNGTGYIGFETVGRNAKLIK
tara:strand:+ start:3335 stop:3532 length:198 start_codon:yes stop_codon:yes gene_type:complete